jgi:hypothetical protein
MRTFCESLEKNPDPEGLIAACGRLPKVHLLGKVLSKASNRTILQFFSIFFRATMVLSRIFEVSTVSASKESKPAPGLAQQPHS